MPDIQISDHMTKNLSAHLNRRIFKRQSSLLQQQSSYISQFNDDFTAAKPLILFKEQSNQGKGSPSKDYLNISEFNNQHSTIILNDEMNLQNDQLAIANQFNNENFKQNSLKTQFFVNINNKQPDQEQPKPLINVVPLSSCKLINQASFEEKEEQKTSFTTAKQDKTKQSATIIDSKDLKPQTSLMQPPLSSGKKQDQQVSKVLAQSKKRSKKKLYSSKFQIPNENSESSWVQNCFLPSNFIVIFEKGFSVFTYKFNETFMQQHILCFLTTKDCLQTRLVSKELFRRTTRTLLGRAHENELICLKREMKNLPKNRTQILDIAMNQFQDIQQAFQQFNQVMASDYSQYAVMVIPPQIFLIVLSQFVKLFGGSLFQLNLNILQNKDQWKKAFTTCFIKGHASSIFKTFSENATLETLYKVISPKLYEELKQEMVIHETHLNSLNPTTHPFLYRLFVFMEDLLNLHELLAIKYPIAVQYVLLLLKISENPETKTMSYIDDKFSSFRF